jgi:hypothetical protein
MESFRVLLRDLAVESGLVQQRDEVVVGGHRHVLHGAGEAGDGVAIDVAKAAQPLGVSIVARGVAALRLGRLRAGEDAYTVAARAAGVITVRVLVGIALGRSAQDSDGPPRAPHERSMPRPHAGRILVLEALADGGHGHPSYQWALALTVCRASET